MEFDPKELKPEMQEALERGQAALEEVDKTVQKLIAEKPLMLLCGTLLAGFVAGRVLGRRL